MGIVVSLAMSFFSMFVLASAFEPLSKPVGTQAVINSLNSSALASQSGYGSYMSKLTAKAAADTVYTRAIGSAVTSELLLPSALGEIVGASAATGTGVATGTGTAVTTGVVGTETVAGRVGVTYTAALVESFGTAAAVAQSGVVVNGVLKVASSAMTGGTYLGLLWMGYEIGSSLMDYMVGDPVTSGETLPLVPLTDFKTSTLAEKPNTLPETVNIMPLSSQDATRRENQTKAATKVGCPDNPLIPAVALCFQNKDAYIVSTASIQKSLELYEGQKLAYINLPMTIGQQTLDDFKTFFERDWDYLSGVSNVSLKNFTFPYSGNYSSVAFDFTYLQGTRTEEGESDFTMYSIENPSDPCPVGTKFSKNDWTLHTKICVPDYATDTVTPNYNKAYTKLGTYPHYEVYPSGAIKPYPQVVSQLQQSAQSGTGKPFSISSQLNENSLGFSKTANQFVGGDVVVKTEGGEIIISKTLSNFKMKHRDGVDFTLSIREILKYSISTLTLISREVSYDTSDGTKLTPDNTFMSPDTFGSPDLALSPRFDVQSVPKFDTGTGTGTGTTPDTGTTTGTGTNTGTGTTPNTGTTTGTGTGTTTENVPCGLGRNVSIVKKALDGTSSTVTVPSPPCLINWGKVPTGSNVPNFPEKTPADFKPIFDKLPAFIGDPSKWFPTSDRCVFPSIDLRNADVSFLRSIAIEYKLDGICNVLSGFQEMLRALAMISWFFLALWVVLDA